MSRKVVVAIFSCVFACCLALVGCGSGDGNNAAKQAFMGTWDLVEMSENGEVTTQEDIEMLEAFGLEVYVNLNEDGSSELVVFGDAKKGSWEAKSETEGSMTIEGELAGMTIADERLTVEQGESSLVFVKGEAKEAPTAEASASASSSAS